MYMYTYTLSKNTYMNISEPPRTSPQQDAAVTGGTPLPPPPSSQQPQAYIQVSSKTCTR